MELAIEPAIADFEATVADFELAIADFEAAVADFELAIADFAVPPRLAVVTAACSESGPVLRIRGGKLGVSEGVGVGGGAAVFVGSGLWGLRWYVKV